MFDVRKFITDLHNTVECTGSFGFNEPMSAHTTFQVGGPADLWVCPGRAGFRDYCAVLLRNAQTEGIPVFVLGGGANLVVADAGIRGIALDTGNWTGYTRGAGGDIVFRSGVSADTAAETACELGLSGLEFLAGMPGSIGGAVWMNARCYETSVSDVLAETEILDETFSVKNIPVRQEEYGYKKSPFQNRKVLILSARFSLDFFSLDFSFLEKNFSSLDFFSLEKKEKKILKENCEEENFLSKQDEEKKAETRRKMEAYRRDREAKGHYRFPSAGSAFKNNRDFGKPTGRIIDELGLKGLVRGGAMVAPWHGNLIVNVGTASAADIRALVEEVAAKVKHRLGIDLEPEILFIGDF
ncbi:MAG: UDP-N-acetylmuramate dehydrogenase [Spirochaetaceae bacterium]|jgi:UDP-N-acetylmuramate dehydrogenase|nr:UDP-N-acetylmuramate dehydrogenase [Spirochaetaceae bacterium]